MPSQKELQLLTVLKETNEPSQFLRSVFSFLSQERKAKLAIESDNLKRVSAEDYDDLSNRLDAVPMQESCSVRNVLRTRRLANLLVSDNGEINLSSIPRVVKHLEEHLYSLGSQRQHDAMRQEHILKVLRLLMVNKDLVRLLRSINKPYSHPIAEQFIRDTLMLPMGASVTDAHARRAAFSAWMCYLRQNVGSCFATAPAIIIHDEQPEQFLADIKEILGTGRLKRTFAGVEYAVPISHTWGAGDLRKPIAVPTGPAFERSHLWLSPGLIAAFEAAEIIPHDLMPNEQISHGKKVLMDLAATWKTSQPVILSSAEDLIKGALLKFLNISAQDLTDFDNRPKAMIHTSLLMQTPPKSGRPLNKREACTKFHQLYKFAASAFKGLADNALLKVWEFTVASFSDIKSEFTRWNLYSSLGLGQDEENGIGQCLARYIQNRLDYWNRKTQDYQFEYEQIFLQVKQLESRVKSASSETEARWVRADYQSKLHEFHALEDMRNEANGKAHSFANLFNVIIKEFYRLFPVYFQEVYDADMHEMIVGPYDDSPAGFRLIYKHGRSNTSQWTRVNTPQEYIDSLAAFFIAAEVEIAALDGLSDIQQDLSEIITDIVHFVKTPQFLEYSFHRMATAHQMPLIAKPLENLDKIEKKPWAYTSGGTVGTLLSCYYRREQKPSISERWVENPLELLIFIIDVLKQIPYKSMEPFAADSKRSMLMHSPTHAFILKPGMSTFCESWQNDAYTYTWARDYLIRPMENFIINLTFTEEMKPFLIQEISKLVPENYRPYFQKIFSSIPRIHSSIDEVRDYIIKKMGSERGLQFSERRSVISADDIDGVLLSAFPLIPRYQIDKAVLAICEHLPEMSPQKLAQLADLAEEAVKALSSSYITAQGLQDLCKGLLSIVEERNYAAYDYHFLISQSAQKVGYAIPTTAIWADTNWVKDYFAFIVNPGTRKLELWRIDYTGRVGAPMSIWREWLNGSRKDKMWGVYGRSYEYGQ